MQSIKRVSNYTFLVAEWGGEGHSRGVRTLALVLPQGFEYCRMIRNGVVDALEQAGAWQVLQLPVHESGRIPVKRGMESLGGVIAWAERKHEWMAELAGRGIPVVNCGGDWRGAPGVATLVVDLASVLRLAVGHFKDLSLRKVYYFGHRTSSDPRRGHAKRMLAELAAGEGIEVDGLETRGKNPDENLERLLAPELEYSLIEQFGRLGESVGLFAENDYFARLACNVAKLAGKTVPGDLAILGTSGDLLGRFGDPTISTVPFPGKEIGRTAFQIIDGVHQGASLPEEAVSVEASTIIVRESTGGKSRDVAMERVARWIEREAFHGLTVQELGDVAGMSLKALRRRYKTVHGEEPSEHIKRLRLSKAREMLGKGGDPIADVALACGFSSQAAFYNYFLRHQGIAPTEFRKSKALGAG